MTRAARMLAVLFTTCGAAGALAEGRDAEGQDGATIRGRVARAGASRLSGLHVLRLYALPEDRPAHPQDALIDHTRSPLADIPIERRRGTEPHRFLLEDVVPGEYVITGYASGHYLERRVSVSEEDDVIEVVLSREDSARPHREHFLIHGEALDGRTLEPLAGVKVVFRLGSLHRSGGVRGFETTEVIGDRGEYTIAPERLEKGFHLVMEAEGYVGAVRRIEETPRELRNDFVLEPFSGERIAAVASSGGHPLRGVATIETGGVLGRVRRTIAEDGTFALDGIPAGEHVVRVRYPAYRFRRSRGGGDGSFVGTLRITGGPQRLALRGAVGRVLTLRLVPSEEGEELLSARMWARVVPQSGPAGAWNDFGSRRRPSWFMAGLPSSGTLEVVAVGHLRGWAPVYASARLALQGVDPSRLVAIPLAVGRRLAVRILNEEGKPARRPYATPRPLIPALRLEAEPVPSSGSWPLGDLGEALGATFFRLDDGAPRITVFPSLDDEVYVLSEDGGAVLRPEELRDLHEGDEIEVRAEGFLRGEVAGAKPHRVYTLSVELAGGRRIEVFTDYGGSFCFPVGEERVRRVGVRGKEAVVRDPAPGEFVRLAPE